MGVGLHTVGLECRGLACRVWGVGFRVQVQHQGLGWFMFWGNISTV